MNPRCTPQGIRMAHGADQRANVSGDCRSTRTGSTLPGPPWTEATAVPRDDRVGLDEDQRCPPLGPDAREPQPQEAVGPRQTNAPTVGSFHDLKLLSQREDLEVQSSPRANQ
jgi:hypothetical protein